MYLGQGGMFHEIQCKTLTERSQLQRIFLHSFATRRKSLKKFLARPYFHFYITLDTFTMNK